MEMYDLSVTIRPGMDVFPGDPPFRADAAATIGRDGCNVLDLSMGTHTGTHIDVPRHFLAEGAPVDAVGPERFTGPAWFADLTREAATGILDLVRMDLSMLCPGDFLVLRTGWEERRGTPGFFTGLPRFAPGSAERLASLGVGMLGTDMPTVLAALPDGDAVDSPETGGVPRDASVMHRALLSRGILLLEGLVGLAPLCGRRLTLFALPLRIAGADGSPVRAVAVEGLLPSGLSAGAAT
ncbi:MAG: cyclase family protein [Clostridia bacterium]|nr:cyclase family protein [Clostridia bacterium]